MTNNNNFSSIDLDNLSSVTGGIFGFGSKKPAPTPTRPTPAAPTHNPQRQQQEVNDLMLHIPSLVL